MRQSYGSPHSATVATRRQPFIQRQRECLYRSALFVHVMPVGWPPQRWRARRQHPAPGGGHEGGDLGHGVWGAISPPAWAVPGSVVPASAVPTSGHRQADAHFRNGPCSPSHLAGLEIPPWSRCRSTSGEPTSSSSAAPAGSTSALRLWARAPAVVSAQAVVCTVDGGCADRCLCSSRRWTPSVIREMP